MAHNALTRPKVSIYIATSIDGYIARKNGTLDWLDRVGDPNEDHRFNKLIDSIDGVILGRNTYEVAAGVPDWPYTGRRLIVLSNTLQTVREGAELFRVDLTELTPQLYSDGIQHLWIDGGVTVSQFLDLQMVDKELSCHLVSSQSYPSGLVQSTYKMIA